MYTAQERAIREKAEAFTEGEMRAVLSVARLDYLFDELYKRIDDHNEGWIDVNKKLPRIGKRVLVTAYGRVCYAMLHSPDGNNGYPIFLLQDSLKERVVCETTVHNDLTTGRITAWMPLPEPYKAESEEK